jgi:hypothetical protein
LNLHPILYHRKLKILHKELRTSRRSYKLPIWMLNTWNCKLLHRERKRCKPYLEKF